MRGWAAERPTILVVLVGVVALGWILAGCEKTPPEPETQPANTARDDAYIAALAVANEFCQAWKHRDEAAGRALLSLRLIRQHSDKRLSAAIVGVSNPHHAAYEISEGRKLAEGRYEFKLRLFFQYTGLHGDRIESPLDRIVVARIDAEHWRVDQFPIP